VTQVLSDMKSDVETKKMNVSLARFGSRARRAREVYSASPCVSDRRQT